MKILGMNCLNHDAAMAVVDGNKIIWAAHAERYSKIKNDHYRSGHGKQLAQTDVHFAPTLEILA